MANRPQMRMTGTGGGFGDGMSPGQQMRAAGGPMDGMRGASSYAPGGGQPMGAPVGDGMPQQQMPRQMPGPMPQPSWAGGTQVGAQDRGGGIVGGAAPPIDPRLLALMQQRR
jgi:hypothetical protein